MTEQKNVGMQLTDEAIRHLADLAFVTGKTKSAVVADALALLYAQRFTPAMRAALASIRGNGVRPKLVGGRRRGAK